MLPSVRKAASDGATLFWNGDYIWAITEPHPWHPAPGVSEDSATAVMINCGTFVKFPSYLSGIWPCVWARRTKKKQPINMFFYFFLFLLIHPKSRTQWWMSLLLYFLIWFPSGALTGLSFHAALWPENLHQGFFILESWFKKGQSIGKESGLHCCRPVKPVSMFTDWDCSIVFNVATLWLYSLLHSHPTLIPPRNTFLPNTLSWQTKQEWCTKEKKKNIVRLVESNLLSLNKV